MIDANSNVNDFKFFNSDLTSTVKPQWFQVNPSSLPNYKLIAVGSAPASGAGAAATAPKPAAP